MNFLDWLRHVGEILFFNLFLAGLALLAAWLFGWFKPLDMGGRKNKKSRREADED